MEGWQLGSRTSMNSGQLWIYLLRPQGPLSLLWMGIKIVLNVFERQPHFDVYHASEVWVDTRSRRLSVSLDGEIHVMQTPLRFRSLHRALKVFVP
jgi:diacylglycerol kinase family enzyme